MKKWQLVISLSGTFWDILGLVGVDMILMTDYTPRIDTTWKTKNLYWDESMQNGFEMGM